MAEQLPDGWFRNTNGRSIFSEDGRWLLTPCVTQGGYDAYERHSDKGPTYIGRFDTISDFAAYLEEG